MARRQFDRAEQLMVAAGFDAHIGPGQWRPGQQGHIMGLQAVASPMFLKENLGGYIKERSCADVRKYQEKMKKEAASSPIVDT